MSIDLIGNTTMRELAGYLDRLAQRQTVVAANIANIDTPGYKTKDLDFGSTLSAAMASGGGSLLRTDSAHLPAAAGSGSPIVKEVDDLPVRWDQNNVSLDREAAKLSEIALRFSAAAQMYTSRGRTIRLAINEGR